MPEPGCCIQSFPTPQKADFIKRSDCNPIIYPKKWGKKKSLQRNLLKNPNLICRLLELLPSVTSGHGAPRNFEESELVLVERLAKFLKGSSAAVAATNSFPKRQWKIWALKTQIKVTALTSSVPVSGPITQLVVSSSSSLHPSVCFPFIPG